MDEAEYGVRAPSLDDGTLLLQEEVLTPQKTASMQADKEMFVSDVRAAKQDTRTCHLVLIASLVILSFNLVFILLRLVGMDLPEVSTTNVSVSFIACFAPLWVQRWALDRSQQRSARQLTALIGDGASVPVAMTKRFVSDRDHQRKIYVDLLTNGSSLVSSSDAGFRLTLDTSSDSKYVVRLVQSRQ